jgi:uncharacterized protein YndB with AHSA1/START domain
MNTDRIEKKIILRAPLQRVWLAIADSSKFGRWFGMKFDGPFAPGTRMRGSIVPTAVDAEVAQMQKNYEGIPIDMMIERMEPERLFSYRWHPGSVDPAVDYSVEPTTLVTFELEEVPDGVLLTITETGFDQIPLSRRAKAFETNEGGWAIQVTLINKYLQHEQ